MKIFLALGVALGALLVTAGHDTTPAKHGQPEPLRVTAMSSSTPTPTPVTPIRYRGAYDNATQSSTCVIPGFTPEATNWNDFTAQSLANGCRVHYNGRPAGTPVGTIHGVGAYAGREGDDGYLPSQYLGTVAPGQVLPAGSLIIASVNGITIARGHW